MTPDRLRLLGALVALAASCILGAIIAVLSGGA
jgi:hypothetical protein